MLWLRLLQKVEIFIEFRDNPEGGIGMINSSSSSVPYDVSSLVTGASAFCKPTISSARNGSMGADARTSSPAAAHYLEPKAKNSPDTAVAEATDDVSAKYKECLRNHAAAVGGHILDGCGEFMPEGDPSTADALKCSACGCHRSFHRRADGGNSCYHGRASRLPRLLPPPSTHQKPPFHFGGGLSSCPSPAGMLPPPDYVLSRNNLTTGSGGATTESSSDERIHSSAAPAATMPRKLFRTKFTEEQKQRMMAFAEKVGWRIQRQSDAMVHQFCAEIGVRRHAFKVWMHNNKRGTKRKQPLPPPSPPAKQEQLLFVLQHH